MASGDEPTPYKLTEEVLALCRELIEGPEIEGGEVGRLCEQCQNQLSGDGRKAFTISAQAFAKLVHYLVEETTLHGSFLTRAKLEKLEATSKDSVATFRELGDTKGLAFGLHGRCGVLALQGETSKAMSTAQRALQAMEMEEDKLGEAGTLATIVNIHLIRSTSDINQYVYMSEKADEKLRQLEEQREKLKEQALEIAHDVVEIYRRLGDKRKEAQALDKVANVHIIKQEVSQAKDVAQIVKEIYTELEDLTGQSTALHTIMTASMQSEDDIDDALDAARENISMYRNTRQGKLDKKGEADATHSYAQVLLQAGEFEQAMLSAEEALQAFQSLGERRKGEAPVYYTMAAIRKSRGETEGAVADTLKAAKAYEEVGDKAGQAAALHHASQMDFETLYEELNKAPDVFTDEHSKRLEANWNNLMKSGELYQQCEDEIGQEAVAQTVQKAMDDARRIHAKIAEPTKTYYLMNNKREYQGLVHYYEVINENDEQQDAFVIKKGVDGSMKLGGKELLPDSGTA